GYADEARTDLRSLQVVQHVGAHDEIEARVEAQVFELAEAREAEVAAAPVTRHRVLAGVQPAVVEAGPQRTQRRAPGAFTAAYVQHVADRPAEVVLRLRHHHRDLASELGR